jgi:predicted Zn finger-like uncharacterized protein
MTVPVQCPHCKQTYNLAESMLGKSVRCKACQNVFEVQRAKATSVSAGPPRAKSAAVSAPPPLRRRELDDVEVVDDDDDQDRERDREDRDRPRKRRRKREREGSSATMWIVSGVVGVVCFVIAFVVVFFLMRRSAQPQVAQGPPANPPANPPAVNAPAANPGAAFQQAPGQPVVQAPAGQPPAGQPRAVNPVNPPMNPAPQAQGGNFPGAEIAPPGLYGDQGGDPVFPADPGLPDTILRARADETFYRLVNARVGSPTTPFGAPRPGQALLVDYEVVRHGKHRGSTLIIHGGDGRRSQVHLLGFGLGGRDRGTVEVTTFGPFGSFPKNAEIYLTRHDGRWGKHSPTFKVSNSVIMGAMGVTTKARNWTKEEIDRYTKDPPNHLAVNVHPNVGKDTDFVGEVKGGVLMRYVEPKGHLLGLEVRLGEWEKEKCIGGGLTAIFSRDQAPNWPQAQRLIAKDGYAVAGAEVHTGKFVTGIKLLYQRLKTDGTLDPKDAYSSELVGYTGQANKLGDDGRPVIGIHIRQGAITNALALVMRE